MLYKLFSEIVDFRKRDSPCRGRERISNIIFGEFVGTFRFELKLKK
jgi:hypothetical protein